MLQARNLCEELCIVQAAREAFLTDSFDPAKYGQIFNVTSAEILNIIEDSIFTDVINKMCEKMFDAQIKCSFEREQKMFEQNERDLVESIELPDGYIEFPFTNLHKSMNGFQIQTSNNFYFYLVTKVANMSKI